MLFTCYNNHVLCDIKNFYKILIKKKEHSKKTFILTLIIIFLFLILGYKGIHLLIYNTNIIEKEEYLSLIEGYQVKDIENIKTKKLDDSQYISYKGAKIKNIFNEK